MKRFFGATFIALAIILGATIQAVSGVGTTRIGSTYSLADADAVGTDLARYVIEADPGYEAQILRETLEAGVAVRRVVRGVLDVETSAATAAELAKLPRVRSVDTLAQAVETDERAAVGVTVANAVAAAGGEGAKAVGAPKWRAAGITGRAVRIAVIDTGFRDWDRATAAGELGRNSVVSKHNYCDAGFERTSHGTATAEILYDMAPEAALTLICIDDALDLAQAIEPLLAEGTQIVNMSVGFFNTSRGDGSGGPASPDASARRAMAEGLTWVNSAGNEALVHYSGTFTDSNGNGVHEWAPGDESMAFKVGARGRIDVYLKWDEWAAVVDDYELCLTNTPMSPLRCFPSKVAERGLPTAAIGLTSPFDETVELYAYVRRVAGTGSPHFDVVFLGADSIEHSTAAGSIAEPASAPGVVAVGAVCTASGALRPYSSRGPTVDGRAGIALTAPGSVSGFVMGAVTGCDGGYGGTSAAAPHVAGALALLAQGFPKYRRDQLIAELLNRAGRATDSSLADPARGYGMLTLGNPPSVLDGPGGDPGDPAEPPASAEGFAIGISSSADRSHPDVFLYPTLSGDAYIFLTPTFPTGVDQVRFSIDGTLRQVEKLAAFDVGGGGRNSAFPLDTTALANGPHRLNAEIRLSSGRVTELSAPFVVDNGAAGPKPTSFDLTVGSTGTLLDRSVVHGTQRIALRINKTNLAIKHVLFYIDADLLRLDQDAPFALSDSFDLSTLTVGQHMSQAIVYLADGQVMAANASFTATA